MSSAGAFALLAALIGMIIGSFLALVADRWPRGESIVAARSRCTSCGTTLRAWNLVPVLSFSIQRARCSHCRAALPIDLLLAELGGGVVALLALSTGGNVAAMATLAVFGWTLLLLALLDARHLWLPDALTLPLCLAGFASAAVLPTLSLPDRLIGVAAGFISLELVRRVYRWLRGREGLGGGDPKLLAAIGAWLGAPTLPIIVMCAALLGLGWAGLLSLRKAAITETTPLPLGTFLALGAVAAVPWVYRSVN
jgi:leader peptidase (prepilin peptidase) / N-methyltransferase